ncbi:hypothetical protein M0R45_020776 [Rubus argutus]|uniref:Uncharacterized protein n=1 Tax=Rubus argutus TaxID=59490 RepID=A0AAW1XCI5_RUBAR
MVIASVPAFQFIASGFAAFVSKHNGSRDVPKENQEGQAATPQQLLRPSRVLSEVVQEDQEPDSPTLFQTMI